MVFFSPVILKWKEPRYIIQRTLATIEDIFFVFPDQVLIYLTYEIFRKHSIKFEKRNDLPLLSKNEAAKEVRGQAETSHFKRAEHAGYNSDV